MLKEAHEDDPVRDQDVLGLLLASNVGKEEEHHGNDQAGEGNEGDIEV